MTDNGSSENASGADQAEPPETGREKLNRIGGIVFGCIAVVAIGVRIFGGSSGSEQDEQLAEGPTANAVATSAKGTGSAAATSAEINPAIWNCMASKNDFLDVQRAQDATGHAGNREPVEVHPWATSPSELAYVEEFCCKPNKVPKADCKGLADAVRAKSHADTKATAEEEKALGY